MNNLLNREELLRLAFHTTPYTLSYNPDIAQYINYLPLNKGRISGYGFSMCEGSKHFFLGNYYISIKSRDSRLKILIPEEYILRI